jgi:lycopene beta-cyclase
MKNQPMNYDYIIAGAGSAGLSLLYSLLQDSELSKSKILLVDKDTKQQNDRTWCFWERETGHFESIVHHEWKTLEFKTEDFKRQFELEEYSYKMIRGIDFYEFVLAFAKKFDNVTFCYESIISIDSDKGKAKLITENGEYTANYVFNSTPIFNPEMTTENSLLQHFEGWEIETKQPVFDEKVGTLMDFSLSQENGATFMYVLPTSSTKALVEYTLFSPKLLDKEAYKTALKNYIKDDLNIEEFEITHQEFGIIPMSLAKFDPSPKNKDRIVNIGTAGGYTKASSGYTFQFVQTHTKLMIEAIKQGKSPVVSPSLRKKMFNWYDKTVLDVMLTKKMTGKEIFSIMFKKLNPEKILAFLGNESTFWQEIKTMNSVPLIPFVSSGIKQFFSKK